MNGTKAVNIRNDGYITGLPAYVIVEVSAVANASGIHSTAPGKMPETVAELCRREVAVHSLAVDAAVRGDRDVALQGLLLDPMIDDIDRARAILDDYLTVHADYLPQFHGSWVWDGPSTADSESRGR